MSLWHLGDARETSVAGCFLQLPPNKHIPPHFPSRAAAQNENNPPLMHAPALSNRSEDQFQLMHSKHGHCPFKFIPCTVSFFFLFFLPHSVHLLCSAHRPSVLPPPVTCLQAVVVQRHCHVVSRCCRPDTREPNMSQWRHGADSVSARVRVWSRGWCVRASVPPNHWHSPGFFQGHLTRTPL